MYTNLKYLRIKNKFTQLEISKKLNISQSLYSNYETGKKTIPIYVLSNIAKIYNTSIDFIVGDTLEEKAFPKTLFKS